MSRLLTMWVSLVLLIGVVVIGKVAHAQSPKTITNTIGMKLVLIPKGTFQMGSPPKDNVSPGDEHQHKVTLTKDYYLGTFEVTQAQYRKVMGKNPSHFQGKNLLFSVVSEAASADFPVDSVSWEDAVEFCEKLSALPEEKKAGRVYRLPTEAEWEYACRAGSKTAFSFGESEKSLSDFAWFIENSQKQTHPVGKKKSNAWGLYDMHGNVWEWCSDWYGEYPKGAVIDDEGAEKGLSRVYRGGSWNYDCSDCRSAVRGRDFPSIRSNLFGFRVALSLSGAPNFGLTGNNTEEKTVGVWASKFDKLFSEISLLNTEAERVAEKKFQDLAESSRKSHERKIKDLREKLENAKKRKISLEEEDELEKNVTRTIKIIQEEADLAVEELSKAADFFKKTRLFPVVEKYKIQNDIIDTNRKKIIDIYSDYDYKRILYWQFLATTAIDLEQIGNKKRDRDLYNEAKHRLKQIYDENNFKIINKTFSGAMIYSVLKNGTTLRTICDKSYAKHPSGNIIVKSKEMGKLKLEYQDSEKLIKDIEGIVDFKTVSNKDCNRQIAINGDSNFFEKLEIQMPKSEKDIFEFKFSLGNIYVDAEIEGFEKDLYLLRTQLIPKFFGEDFEPKITKRPATKMLPSRFVGEYGVMEMAVNDMPLSEKLLAGAKASWKLPSSLILQYDSKETNWLVNLDETNGIADFYDNHSDGTSKFYPAVFSRNGNYLVFQIAKAGKTRPKGNISEIIKDTEKLRIKKFVAPDLTVTRQRPELQPAEGQTVLIDVIARDPEMGSMRIEYKLDEMDWQAISAKDGKGGPVQFEKVVIGNHKVRVRALSLATGLSIEKEVDFTVRKLMPPTIEFKLKSNTNRVNYGEEALVKVKAIDPEKGQCLAEWKSGDGPWKKIGQSEGNYDGDLSVPNLKIGENELRFRSFSVATSKYSEEKKLVIFYAIPSEWKGKANFLTNRISLNDDIFMTLGDFSETDNKLYAKGTYTAYHGNRPSVFDNSVLIIDKKNDKNDRILDFELITGSKSRPRQYVCKGKIDLDKMIMRAFPIEDNVTPKNLKNREELLRKSTIYLQKNDISDPRE